MSATWRKKGAQLKQMRLWKPPHISLSHDADVSFCLFCLMSWCLSWRSWCAVALTCLDTCRCEAYLTQTNIHTLSGIQTHDPSLRASEDASFLRPRGHCNRPCIHHRIIKQVMQLVIICAKEESWDVLSLVCRNRKITVCNMMCWLYMC
jgi:hypothetical protein